MRVTDKRKCLEAFKEPEAITRTVGADLAKAILAQGPPTVNAVRWVSLFWECWQVRNPSRL
jgi:hypothetical protein